jgi:hypothetical protein
LNEETSSGLDTESASTPAPASAEAPSPAASPPAEAKDVSGSSSPASGETKVESRESLLDVVRKATSPQEARPGHGGVKGDVGQGGSATPGVQSKEDLGPLTEAEIETYPYKSQKRIAKLLAEQRDLKQQIAPLEAQAKTTAELQSFLKQADIGREEFGLVLDISAALKRGDHRAFLEGIAPYVKLAQESLGISLPPDLQQAVQTGHMTQDAARYVAQVRSAQQLAETKLNRTTQETSQRAHAEAVQQFQASVASSVSQWEQEVKRADPDYARKEPIVRDLLHAVVQERGPPSSPAEAVEIARQAYQRANAIASRFIPSPRSTQQVPSSLNRVNGAAPQPRSLKEAVQIALERSR